MFTGIIQKIAVVHSIQYIEDLMCFSILADPQFLSNLKIGASIAVDGVCLTTVRFTHNEVFFDVINETLKQTTLKEMKKGECVNVERAASFGDEIGGHILSGHIMETAQIHAIQPSKNSSIFTLKCSKNILKYLFPKGYVALNGTSLTVVEINEILQTFTVHLIPETLKKTTFQNKYVGDKINIEVDSQTQILVETVIKTIHQFLPHQKNF